jgi:hypothetical protein
VAYYGAYELRVWRGGGTGDPIVAAATGAQGRLAAAVDRLGAGALAAVFAALLAGAALLAWRSRRASRPRRTRSEAGGVIRD